MHLTFVCRIFLSGFRFYKKFELCSSKQLSLVIHLGENKSENFREIFTLRITPLNNEKWESGIEAEK